MLSLLILAVARTLGQETVKDRWVAAPSEDYGIVGSVWDADGKIKCLGLVTKGKFLRTIHGCASGGAIFGVGSATGGGLFRSVSLVEESTYISLVTLNTARDTPVLKAVDITDNFDYHVNFVAYRFADSTLEKRSFRYFNASTRVSQPGAPGATSFSQDEFYVEPTEGEPGPLPLGSPLIARPRSHTDERFVSGLFRRRVGNLFYFAKVRVFQEYESPQSQVR